MIDLQDMPLSDPEYEEEDENDGGEEDELDGIDEADEEDDVDIPTIPAESTPSAPFDEKTFQTNLSAQMEQLRLNKALGNDEGYTSPLSDNAHRRLNNDDSDSSEDLLSDGPPQSDFTAYTRTRVHHARPSAKKIDTNPLSLKNVVARQVEKELNGSERGGSVGKSKGKVGKAKGHKWKANPNYAVGGKGDGWQ